jgi:hypothetical protein
MAIHVGSRWAHQEIIVSDYKRRQSFFKRRTSELANSDVHLLV